nr:MAG: ORF2 [Torque teno polar bear virus 40]
MNGMSTFSSAAEEAWLVSIAASHRAWCPCGEYRNHIPGWRGGDDGGDAGASGAPVEGGDFAGVGEPTDEDMAVAAVSFDLDFVDTDAGPR